MNPLEKGLFYLRKKGNSESQWGKKMEKFVIKLIVCSIFVMLPSCGSFTGISSFNTDDGQEQAFAEKEDLGSIGWCGKIGSVPNGKGKTSIQVAPFMEKSNFRIYRDILLVDKNGVLLSKRKEKRKFELNRNGVCLTLARNWLAISGYIGKAELEPSLGYHTKAGSGIFGGISVAGRFLKYKKIGFGSALKVLGDRGSLKYSGDPSFSKSDQKWIDLDMKNGFAYLPGPSSAFSFSPFAGVGLRWIDGFEDTEPYGFKPDFGGFLVYGYFGAKVEGRIGKASSIGAGIDIDVGQVSGLSVSVSVSF